MLAFPSSTLTLLEDHEAWYCSGIKEPHESYPARHLLASMKLVLPNTLPQLRIFRSIMSVQLMTAPYRIADREYMQLLCGAPVVLVLILITVGPNARRLGRQTEGDNESRKSP